jgi:hypothetical protein
MSTLTNGRLFVDVISRGLRRPYLTEVLVSSTAYTRLSNTDSTQAVYLYYKPSHKCLRRMMAEAK